MKFKFGNRVNIVEGFHRGQSGTVIGHYEQYAYRGLGDHFQIRLDNCEFGNIDTVAHEAWLEFCLLDTDGFKK